MRALLPGLIAILSWSAIVHAQEVPAAEEPLWPGGAVNAYFGPGPAYRLTIESENGVVSVIEVPEGVFLGIVSARDPSGGLGDWTLPKTVTGTVRIRTRRGDELQAGEEDADAILSKSPFQVTLRNVSVHIESVGGTKP